MTSLNPQDPSSSRPGHHYQQVCIKGSDGAHLGDTIHISNYHGAMIDSRSARSQFRNKHFEVPRDPSAVFTGRKEVLQQLRAKCLPSSRPNSQGQPKRFVIYGLGGSGKTQVCLKFTEEHREEFWGIFWIDASTTESLERGFWQLASVCALKPDMEFVKGWLSNTPESWVLILDNADDPSVDFSRFFPAGNRGIILITTRNPDCQNYATVGSYKMGAMTTDDAVELFLKRIDTEILSDASVRDKARPVVLILRCLALAVVQAGAAIREGRCRIEEYCTVYSRHRQELLSRRSVQGAWDYRYTVYTTWDVSLKMIEEKSSEDARDAIELLKIFSFLHHDGIEERMFYQAWEKMQKSKSSDWMLSRKPDIEPGQTIRERDVYHFRAAVALLVHFSLVNRDKDHLISIHPLVQAWARDRLSPLDQRTTWRQTTLTVALSISRTTELRDFEFRRSLEPHIDACLGDRSYKIFDLHGTGEDFRSIVKNFVLVYRAAGRYYDALQLMEGTMEINKRTLGEEHFETLNSMSKIADIYIDFHQPRKAKSLLEQVVKSRMRTQGEKDLNTLASMHSLAIVYSQEGQPNEALRLTKEVVKSNQEVRIEKDRETLATRRSLANRYSDVGRREDALDLMEEVTIACKEHLGVGDVETMRSMHSLAAVYSEVNRRPEAQQLIKRVRNLYGENLGENHLETHQAMLDVGLCNHGVPGSQWSGPVVHRPASIKDGDIYDFHGPSTVWTSPDQ